MSLIRFKTHPVQAPFFAGKFMNWPFNDNLAEFNGRETQGNVPAVNVSETENAFLVEVAAPGLEKENFSIDLNKNLLTISASESVQTAVQVNSEGSENAPEEKNAVEKPAHRYIRREFHYSSFQRSFRLPETADVNAIEAKYINGVLHLLIPKKQDAETSKFKINIA